MLSRFALQLNCSETYRISLFREQSERIWTIEYATLTFRYDTVENWKTGLRLNKTDSFCDGDVCGALSNLPAHVKLYSKTVFIDGIK